MSAARGAQSGCATDAYAAPALCPGLEARATGEPVGGLPFAFDLDQLE